VLIERVTWPVGAAVADGMAHVLLDCVAGGASVGFLAGLRHDEARDWWCEALREPHTVTWVARQADDRVVGTVRLKLATLPNSTHRAEVAKLLVHRDARGRGCATALLDAVEDGARQLGRTLLILDTHTGSLAERVYQRRGWRTVGVVPDYAGVPDGTLVSTTFMAKYL
jgi:GNAT superfamily N-acetyltransferase